DFKFAKKVISGFSDLTEKFQSLKTRMLYQCGTLGGGNHYIELCLDEDNGVWMMLHSGSRNIGKELAEYHISIAKKLAHNESLPDRDLAVFLKGTKEMQEYRRDLLWAQEYAFLNRKVMLELYYRVMKKYFPHIERLETVICHHNYVSEETHFGEDLIVTRKGAISARQNEMGIIPGSMGTKSYIVEGLGNPESFHSASHGAGRRMSRGAAKKAYTVKDLEEQTKGIECRKDSGVLDEIPKAYKDIDRVMSFQSDLVKVKYVLRQILNIKG
ncbi:MAG TPA: RtcB family protein, partial [Leptospiraceae bacterium]|nr:RtcB family protein [Leptospiraceae bacterium]